MSHPISITNPEDLLKHSSWVHALALSLVKDSSLADDVVQETWLAALRKPPRKGRTLRSWLAAVVSNSARYSHRSRRRREQRERVYAPSERLASTEELVEIETERRKVVDIVLGLNEPYRTTVLLRFWNDMTAEAIASTQGIPASTVRNRLRRALDRIRAELDRDGEGAQKTLNALIMWAPAGKLISPASAAGFSILPVIGALAMLTKTKLLVGVAILSAAILSWSTMFSHSDGSPKNATNRSDSVGMASTVPALPSPPSLKEERIRIEPTQVIPHDVPSTTVPTPKTIEAFGAVRDEDGLPIGDAIVRFLNDNSDDQYVRTGATGEYIAQNLASGDYQVLCSAPGFLVTGERVSLDDEEERVDFILKPEVEIDIKFRTEDGEPLLETMEEEKTTSFLLRNSLFAVLTEAAPGDTIPEVSPSDRFGRGVYRPESNFTSKDRDGVLVCDTDAPAFVSAVLRNVVLRTQRWNGKDREIEFWISPADLEDLSARLTFRVVQDATGLPLENVSVALANSDTVRIGNVPNSTGQYVFAGECFGRVGLWVRSRGYQPLFQYLELKSGETRDLGELRLVPSVAITGRVIFSEGADADAWLHEFDLDELKPDHQMQTQVVFNSTEKDGSFRVDSWKGKALIVARPKNTRFGLAAVVVDASGGPVQGIEIPVRPAVDVTLFPQFESGVIARVYDAEGLPLWSRLVSGEPQVIALSSGSYRVDVWKEEVIDSVEFEVKNQPIDIDLVP